MFDAVPMAVICIYYMTVSKDLFWLNIFTTALSFLSLALCFVCPESPKWHLINGRTPEAIVIFNEIAKLNGKENRIPSDARFVLDPTNYNDEVEEKLPVVPILKSRSRTVEDTNINQAALLNTKSIHKKISQSKSMAPPKLIKNMNIFQLGKHAFNWQPTLARTD